MKSIYKQVFEKIEPTEELKMQTINKLIDYKNSISAKNKTFPKKLKNERAGLSDKTFLKKRRGLACWISEITAVAALAVALVFIIPPLLYNEDVSGTRGLSYNAVYESVSSQSIVGYSVSKGSAKTEGTIKIPATHKNKPVIAIEKNAFKGCAELTKVVLPDSIINIETAAFQNCKKLESIDIGKNTERIDGFAFSNCGLTSITIPQNVNSIEAFAFADNPLITIKVEVHSSKPDGWNTDWNKNYSSDGYCNVVWEDESNAPTVEAETEGLAYRLIDSSTAYEVSGIGTAVNEERIIIPKTFEGLPVTSIGINAFKDCNTFKSIVLPDSVTSIRAQAFLECTSVKSIIIPNSVIDIGNSAFYKCKDLINIILPNSIKSMGKGVFSNCENITSITIPDSITSISDSTFFRCIKLISVTIPNSVKNIRGNAFFDCDSLANIIIPNSVISIYDMAFGNCDSLASITIPDSVTYIGINPFVNCPSLENINVSEGNTEYKSFGNCILTISSKVLIAGCKNSIIPDDIEGIMHYAFYYCRDLTSIIVPDGVTTIGHCAFSNCYDLVSIIIPASVRNISQRAFGYSENLTIYCESESQPVGWKLDWNFTDDPIVWGYKL